MRRSARLAAAVVALLGLSHPGEAQRAALATVGIPQEVRPQFLPLPEFLIPRTTMLSGLAWYGDDLMLLPQQRPVDGQRSIHRGKLYAIARRALEEAIDGRSAVPLSVDEWTLDAPGVDTLEGFEGFEAVAFAGDSVFMTVEADHAQGPRAWLLRGRIDAASRTVRMEPPEAFVMGQSGVSNLTDEALVVHDGDVISMHEANGAAVNPHPVAHAFPVTWPSGGPWRSRAIPMAPIEYRVTDATETDAEGRFWVSNYFYPGEPSLKASDRIFGGPPRGARSASVAWIERLVELRVTPGGIVPTGRAPIYLEPGAENRNWEGIARFGSRGILLSVDKYPLTRLAFVPFPAR